MSTTRSEPAGRSAGGPGRLSGTRALVTGAARGIGAAIAARFADEGARAVLTGRREVGEDAAHSIREAGGEAHFIRCDASREDQVVDLLAGVEERLGGLDVVVNNAGIAPAGPLEELSLEVWNDVINSNLTTMFLVSKHAVPQLRKSDYASIINLGSTFGVVGAGGSVAYALTKAAAISFSKSLALELAPEGIRVNALCPGATRTDFLEGWASDTGDHDGTMDWLVAHHPLGRLSTADEQADAALFLASRESAFVTGHALMVDGGFTAQ